MDLAEELSRILYEEIDKEIDKVFIKELILKVEVCEKRYKRKLDRKSKKREAKFKKMMRLI